MDHWALRNVLRAGAATKIEIGALLGRDNRTPCGPDRRTYVRARRLRAYILNMRAPSLLPFTRLAPADPVASAVSRAMLAAKLNPPGAASVQVPRKAVCELVCQAGSARVVLIRAPAGFGKTTALLQSRAQLQARGSDTGWLTLDAADNDSSRFLACLA